MINKILILIYVILISIIILLGFTTAYTSNCLDELASVNCGDKESINGEYAVNYICIDNVKVGETYYFTNVEKESCEVFK